MAAKGYQLKSGVTLTGDGMRFNLAGLDKPVDIKPGNLPFATDDVGLQDLLDSHPFLKSAKASEAVTTLLVADRDNDRALEQVDEELEGPGEGPGEGSGGGFSTDSEGEDK